MEGARVAVCQPPGCFQVHSTQAAPLCCSMQPPYTCAPPHPASRSRCRRARQRASNVPARAARAAAGRALRLGRRRPGSTSSRRERKSTIQICHAPAGHVHGCPDGLNQVFVVPVVAYVPRPRPPAVKPRQHAARAAVDDPGRPGRHHLWWGRGGGEGALLARPHAQTHLGRLSFGRGRVRRWRQARAPTCTSWAPVPQRSRERARPARAFPQRPQAHTGAAHLLHKICKRAVQRPDAVVARAARGDEVPRASDERVGG